MCIGFTDIHLHEKENNEIFFLFSAFCVGFVLTETTIRILQCAILLNN